MSLLIGDKLVVTIHYKLTDDSGNVLDNSEGKDPLTYLHGAKNIIPGLEKALVGKTQGAKMQVKVDPVDGYGVVRPELTSVVERSLFQGVDTLKVGMTFEATAPDGSRQQVVVKKVEEDKVTIDANHPLAGVTLNFDVEVVGVREANQEELSHGHVH